MNERKKKLNIYLQSMCICICMEENRLRENVFRSTSGCFFVAAVARMQTRNGK